MFADHTWFETYISTSSGRRSGSSLLQRWWIEHRITIYRPRTRRNSMGNQPRFFGDIRGANINRFTLPSSITALTFNNSSAQSINIFGLLDNGALLTHG
jgi:hypothetical protein